MSLNLPPANHFPPIHTATDRIDRFQRLPSEYNLYLYYLAHVKRRWGSTVRMLTEDLLKWDESELMSPAVSSRPLFSEPSDIRVTYNDWPYLIDPKITHLVVWTKFRIPDDPITGRPTKETNGIIDSWLRRPDVLGARPRRGVKAKGAEGEPEKQSTTADSSAEIIPAANLTWFKNWSAIKSIHALEHFHVMIYDADPEMIESLVGQWRGHGWKPRLPDWLEVNHADAAAVASE